MTVVGRQGTPPRRSGRPDDVRHVASFLRHCAPVRSFLAGRGNGGRNGRACAGRFEVVATREQWVVTGYPCHILQRSGHNNMPAPGSYLGAGGCLCSDTVGFSFPESQCCTHNPAARSLRVRRPSGHLRPAPVPPVAGGDEQQRRQPNPFQTLSCQARLPRNPRTQLEALSLGLFSRDYVCPE